MDTYSAQDVRERWNENAENYAAKCAIHGDENKAVLLTPTILELLGGIRGKTVLDAGCGEGYLCRLMAQRGASVIGLDYAENLLDIARQRTPAGLAVDYKHGNFEDLGLIPDASCDIVVSAAALQDVPDYQSAIRAVYRVLNTGGFFLLAILHPCFSADGGWVRDEDGNKLYWKIDHYFREGPSELQLGLPRSTVYFHRTLTGYVRTVIAAGFTVEDLIEPVPSAEALKAHPEYENDFRMCHWLVLKLRKA